MMTKKVCILTRSLEKGGAEKQSLLLAKALNAQFKTHLVVLYGEEGVAREYEDFLLREEIKPVLLHGVFLRKLVNFMRFLQRNKINTLLCFLYSSNVVGSIAGKFCNVKYIIGGARTSVYPNARKLFIQKLLNNYIFDYTIINNQRGLENLKKKGFLTKKMIYIPNGIEINTPFLCRPQNKKINILSVGRFVEEKDYATAIRSIEILKNNFMPDVHYTIVGYGKLENEIRKMILARRLEDIVDIAVDPKDIEQYYLDSDIFLLTSRFEGFPNTAMEAMHYSLPIVATHVGDMDQLVKENINGFLVGVGDFEAIAHKLSILVKSSQKRNDMGMAGYKVLRDNFSFEKFRGRYFRFINQLI